MPRYQLPNTVQKIKTIKVLEARVLSLNKSVATLPALCDCKTKYTLKEELALANELVALWAQEFQQELDTGVRASMEDMEPSKARAHDY